MSIFVYGDNVDTDVIIPARHLNRFDSEHLKAHCMEDIDAMFASAVREGDLIVAGKNFGCGSSREHAPRAIQAAGIKAVIARSFARIFYRNSVNIGLPIVECSDAVDNILKGHQVEIDLDGGTIVNHTTGCTFQFIPMADFQKEIVRVGGLLNLD